MLLSCSEYQKILSKGSVIEKNIAAEKYYNEGEYRKALNLFEQIMPAYKGKPQAQRVVYFFANFSTKFVPIKPLAPVTRIFLSLKKLKSNRIYC